MKDIFGRQEDEEIARGYGHYNENYDDA